MQASLTVKQFNEYVKTNIKHDPIFARVKINGTLANIRIAHSHLYFSLKEDYDIIDCVIYYYEDKDIYFDFKEGLDVIVSGNVSYNNYASRLVVVAKDIEEKGLSEAYLKFIKIKEDFYKKGYFDEANKKPIPMYPKNVGLITSKDGAAVVDFISVINQKPNDINIKLYPVKVQGLDSYPLIIEAIETLDQMDLDVIVITRGGGSTEDLGVFNDKDIIESAFKAKTPIISAIGHKIDTTLLDLVADLSLQTPTEAGSYLVSNYSNLYKDMGKILSQMKAIISQQIDLAEVNLRAYRRDLKSLSPEKIIDDKITNLDRIKRSIDKQIDNNFNYRAAKLDVFEKRLRAIDTIIEMRKKQIEISKDSVGIYSMHSLNVGDEIEIIFSDGKVKARVIDG